MQTPSHPGAAPLPPTPVIHSGNKSRTSSTPIPKKAKKESTGFGATALVLSALAVVTGALAFYRADQTFSLLRAQISAGSLGAAKGVADTADGVQPVANNQPVTLELDASDPFTGSSDAQVTVVEFSDFQCPFCKVFSETTKKIREAYSPDEVRFVYVDFPLTQIHENAEPAAVAAQCVADLAGNEAFFEFHDQLFARQAELGDALYAELAAQIDGLDQAEFTNCVKNQDSLAEVQADTDMGLAIGVGGTPSTFINGVQVQGGAVSFDKLKALIDAELQK